jgi:hypothetical protein
MKTRFCKRRYAVYVGNLPGDCSPSSATELPAGLHSAVVVFGPTSSAVGQALCRAFNEQQLDNGIPGRRWAVCAFRSRPRSWAGRRERGPAAEEIGRLLLATMAVPVPNCPKVAGGAT